VDIHRFIFLWRACLLTYINSRMDQANGNREGNLKVHWFRRSFLAVTVALIAVGSMSYVNVYWSIKKCSYGGSTNLDTALTTENWIKQEWMRIFTAETAAFLTAKPLVIFKEQWEDIDPRRPVLPVSLTDESIGKFATEYITVWDLYPPNLMCPDAVRLGPVGDGGKWVCGLSWLQRDKMLGSISVAEGGIGRPCLMYSFGISTNSHFEKEIYELAGCEIHAFDPTVGKMPMDRHWPPSRASNRHPRITFHKVALSNVTGPTDIFSYAMSLQDIMHALNHSYVDIIKMDIEGGEWSVFKHLFRDFGRYYKRHHYTTGKADDATNKSTMSGRFLRDRSLIPSNEVTSQLIGKGVPPPWALPFGQLVIELHYSSLSDVDHFFTGMFRAGFLTFSREINLAPTLYGGLPKAVEYSFISPSLFFTGELERRPLTMRGAPPPSDVEFHKPIKAVIYILSQRKRLFMLQEALELLYENYWSDNGRRYPVLIFHDDLGPVEQGYLRKKIPLMTLKFIEIKFRIPSNLDYDMIPNRTTCDPQHSTLGYRHMCRFHATVVHEMLQKHGYGDTEYVWRLDDDSRIVNPIGYDVFSYMKVNHKLYGFIRSLGENIDCVTGLWDLAGAFINRTAANLRINRTEVFFDKWPENLVVFNNFEISHVSVWQNPVWKAFMAEIDKAGGIYMLRWGDAPIHTIGVSMILKVEQVHSFSDIGYYHHMLNQSAGGLPAPNKHAFDHVVCTYYDRWICSSDLYNSTNATNATYALAGPSWGANSAEIQHQQHFFSRIGSHKAPEVGTSMPLVNIVKGDQHAVLYTFAMRGREEKLAATVLSLYTAFIGRFQYPVVIFYSAFSKPLFDRNKVNNLIGREVARYLQYVGVNTVQYYPRSQWENISDAYPCVLSEPEMYAITKFLQLDAIQQLSFMGYEWFFRFDESAQFSRPIAYDIFKSLALGSKRAGFLNIMAASSSCFEGALETVNLLCYGHNNGISASLDILKTRNDYIEPQCSDAMVHWPRYTVILSGFLVTHISVWKSPLCQQLKALMEGSLNADTIAAQVWSSSFLETYCILGGVPMHKIQRLKYMGYSFEWFLPSGDKSSAEGPDAVSLVTDDAHLYLTSPEPTIDALFSPRRFGWLAGDCGYSFALPTVSELTEHIEYMYLAGSDGNITSAEKEPTVGRKASRNPLRSRLKKYVWLFADSLIGTSTSTMYVPDICC
jgi:hypothetical protein